MPRLSTTGSAVTGMGSAQIGINGSVPAALSAYRGGSWSFLTTNLVVGSASIGGGITGFYQYNISGLSVSLLNATGGNFSAAGNSVYGIYLAGPYNGEPAGLRTNVVGLGPLPSSSLTDVSAQGLFATIANRFTGAGVTVYGPTGSTVYTSSSQLTSGNMRVRDGFLTFQDVYGWHLISMATGQAVAEFTPRANIGLVVPFMVGTVLWLLEYDNASGQFSLRPANGGSGWLLPFSDEMFGIDVIGLAGAAKLAWTTGQGEAADELETLTVNLTTGTTTLSTVVGGVLVPGAGPTLEASTFPGANAGAGVLPIQSTPVLNKQGEMTKPWRDALQKLSGGVQAAQTQINNTPTTVVAPGFGDVNGVQAPGPNAGLDITSVDGSVTVTPDQGAQTVDLSVQGGYSYIPMTTGAIPGQILFIGGEVMLTKVPLV